MVALERPLVVVHVQVVHQVADLVELGATPAKLANQHLLLAVACLVHAHQLVVLAVGLQGFYFYILVAGGALAQKVFVKAVWRLS